jgi:hypothetical protein
MKVLILISFATLAFAQAPSTCDRYACSDATHAVATGDCALGVDMNTYKQFYV